MSDYSFMKTGFSNVIETPKVEIDLETVEILLSIFINNALKNAVRYSSLCKRNGVSKDDIIHSLKYEVFEFLNNPDLMDNIEKARTEYNEESFDDEDDEDILNENGDPIIVPDDEIDTFKRIDKDIFNNETEDNKDFINKVHNYYDTWSDWKPKDGLEKILKNAIDKINI